MSAGSEAVANAIALNNSFCYSPSTPKKGVDVIQQASPELIALLKDAEADLAALEKVTRRQIPNFKSRTLAGVRAQIASLTGHDEADAIRADLRINEMKSDGSLERMALERDLAEQVKWEAA